MARVLFAVLLIGAAFYPQQKTTAEPVTSRPVVFVITEAPKLRGQAIAQSRADYMASRGYKGHPPKSSGNQWSIPGANFEGVGWRSNQQTPHRSVGTCRPSGRSGSADDNSRKLLGDAVSRSRYGSFRVRIWGR
jgi:hypothetical protein